MQKSKMASEEALQIAVKRREVKSKGEMERYKHLNAEFQRIARRDKNAFLNSSVSKESACNAGDLDSIPGLGRSPGVENGILLQYSCLENPMDRGAWWAPVHGATRFRHDLVTKPPEIS